MKYDIIGNCFLFQILKLNIQQVPGKAFNNNIFQRFLQDDLIYAF